MTVYQSLIDSAAALLKAKGRKILLRPYQQPTSLNNVTDVSVDPADVTYTLNAIVLPPSTMTVQSYGNQFEAGTMVRSKVRDVYASPKGIAYQVQEGDTLVFDKNAQGLDYEWMILGAEIIAPDATDILWHMTCIR